MRTNDQRRAILWLVLYTLLAVAPLIYMLVGERPMGREFMRELSVALGFTGIGLMALHFALTARIATLHAPYGSDVVYHFHHGISYLTLALWLGHPILLFLKFDWALGLLNIFAADARWTSRWGVLSVAAILLLMALAVLRKALRIDYVVWRMTHGVLAVAAMAMVMVHAYMIGRYIGTEPKRALWLVYGAVAVALVAYLRVIKPWQMLRRPYRLAEVRAEHGSVCSLALEPVGHGGLRFQPGQFAWITARHSPFGAREHPFSFSSSSERRDWLEFAIKELGDFTSTIKDLPEGSTVYVDGPYGSFSPDRHRDVDQLVLIAGGVGISPIMSILRTMADRNDRRPALLIYGLQEWSEACFAGELEGLQARLDLRVVYTLERPPAGWEGETGYVTREMLARHLPPAGTNYRVFLCGPTGMLTSVEKALDSLGVPLSRVEMELFDLA